ncbi:hypothetical protein DO97_09015 [Neosynechococcus sphagnicola sy1]|uniref:Uncharacterized protein n=1 Tax=Neosynechococcus sphagnicola sy1 TaxID=1497020 RepID=A0A098TNH0_9CYAN|nr:hypothetical protein [Neosynechococcus sphagnicola]KGF72388.1 hypothetical protein DO97_09015 [Neosynechococcus sphagnicola sy1]
MPKIIRMAADYDCEPLWDSEEADYVPAEELVLSQQTMERLDEWQAAYDAILNLQDPYEIAFPSPEAEAAWDQEGLALANQLQKELGEEYEIHYNNQPVKTLAQV